MFISLYSAWEQCQMGEYGSRWYVEKTTGGPSTEILSLRLKAKDFMYSIFSRAKRICKTGKQI
jgi:hypothetical protein